MSHNNNPRTSKHPRICLIACIALTTMACSLFGDTQSAEEAARQIRQGATELAIVATEFSRLQTVAPEQVTVAVERLKTAQAMVKEFETGIRDITGTVSSVISHLPSLPIVNTLPVTFGMPVDNAVEVKNCLVGQTCADAPNLHTGIDYWGDPTIKASGPGWVSMIQANDVGCNAEVAGSCRDHGLGNTVIISHELEDGTEIYTLYAHLGKVRDDLKIGMCVYKGEEIGAMGASGYGKADRWGKRPHLHFEFKTGNRLGNTVNKLDSYYGYVKSNAIPNDPLQLGYMNPHDYIDKVAAKPCK